MSIHPSAAAGFSASADTYARGRPGYPPEVDLWLRRDLGLSPGQRVLDLGAGTGKFSGSLLAAGARVVALEPVPAMLEQLARRHPEVEVREGSAETLPFENSSFDAVVCAQSFHWFSTPGALREMHRVLKPGGFLGLIWNVRDARVPWVAALGRLIEPFAGNTPRYHTQEWRRLFPARGFSRLVEQRIPYDHVGAPEQVIVDRTLSISFIAALKPAAQAQIALEVQALIAKTPALAGKCSVSFPYTTVLFSCMKLGGPRQARCTRLHLDPSTG